MVDGFVPLPLEELERLTFQSTSKAMALLAMNAPWLIGEVASLRNQLAASRTAAMEKCCAAARGYADDYQSAEIPAKEATEDIIARIRHAFADDAVVAEVAQVCPPIVMSEEDMNAVALTESLPSQEELISAMGIAPELVNPPLCKPTTRMLNEVDRFHMGLTRDRGT